MCVSRSAFHGLSLFVISFLLLISNFPGRFRCSEETRGESEQGEDEVLDIHDNLIEHADVLSSLVFLEVTISVGEDGDNQVEEHDGTHKGQTKSEQVINSSGVIFMGIPSRKVSEHKPVLVHNGLHGICSTEGIS